MTKITQAIGCGDKLCKLRMILIFYLFMAMALVLIYFFENPIPGTLAYLFGCLWVIRSFCDSTVNLKKKEL